MAVRADAEACLRADGCRLIAGVDEAGRGCLAGPVVAAAVIFPPGSIIAGIDDSKRLSPRRREELDVAIRGQALAVGFGVIREDVIDAVNILQATLLAMQQAVILPSQLTESLSKTSGHSGWTLTTDSNSLRRFNSSSSCGRNRTAFRST